MCADSLPLLQCIASRMDWNTPAFKATILVTGKLDKLHVNRRTDLLHLSVQPFAELYQVDLSDLKVYSGQKNELAKTIFAV